MATSRLVVHPSVQAALAARKAVVALESTIITHGFPSPANLGVALAAEKAVRDAGAVPATVALLDGKAHVGLDRAQIERLAEGGPSKATKTSRRDLASVLAKGRGSVGATTVSGTMILAHMAGIDIFGTGGIGGVHRGGETSMDVSADLTELARTPVAVFSAGAKSILDIPRTLEYLETQGVSVHTFEASGQFPAFYTAHSGCSVPRVHGPNEAARLILEGKRLGLTSGFVFGVPIPSEYEAAGKKIQAAVEQAVAESVAQGIDKRGKEATPWLLKRVSELANESLASNQALMLNSAATAAKTAVELQSLIKEEEEQAKDRGVKVYASSGGFEAIGPDTDKSTVSSELEEITHQIVVVGFAAVDITSQSTTPAIASATTYPGRNHLSLGGVARNMAECAHRLSSSLPSDSRALSSPVRLVCPVGRDALGSYLLQETKELGMRTDGFLLPKLATGKDGEEQCRTASVSLQLDPAGDLISGVADIDPSTFSAHHVRSHLLPLIERPTTLAIDANLGIGTMAEILATSQSNSNVIACLYEPTSVPKCTALIDAIALLQRGGRLNQLGKNGRGTKWGMDVMTPNEIEVIRMASHLSASQLGHPKDGAASGTAVERFISTEEAERLETDVDVCAAAMALSDASGATLLVKGGHRGVLVVLPASTDGPRMFRVPALKVRGEDIVSTTGAGDTFAGSILVDLALRARQEKQRRSSSPQAEAEHRREDKNWWRGAVERGQRAAAITLTSTLPVSPSLDSARLFDLLHQKLIAPA